MKLAYPLKMDGGLPGLDSFCFRSLCVSVRMCEAGASMRSYLLKKRSVSCAKLGRDLPGTSCFLLRCGRCQ